MLPLRFVCLLLFSFFFAPLKILHFGCVIKFCFEIVCLYTLHTCINADISMYIETACTGREYFCISLHSADFTLILSSCQQRLFLLLFVAKNSCLRTFVSFYWQWQKLKTSISAANFVVTAFCVTAGQSKWRYMYINICICIYICNGVHIYLWICVYLSGNNLYFGMLLNRARGGLQCYVNYAVCTYV